VDGEAPRADAGGSPAERLRRLRTSLGLSQEQLARQLGVSFATVNRWEAGRTQMSARAVRALAEFEADVAANRQERDRQQRDRQERDRQQRDRQQPEPDRRRPEPFPVAQSSFVGRAHELAELSTLLGRSRLISLIGPGGAGKTRLAIEAIRRWSPVGEIVFIPLEPVRHQQSLVPAVASALRVHDQPGVPLEASVEAALASAPRLIVLDGAEHLRDGVAALAGRLLGAAPGLRIVATSRVVLGVPGEVCWTVPPLACPSAAAPVSDIASSDAVRLFIAGPRSGCPAFPAPMSPRTPSRSCADGSTASLSRSS
jgi:transcriptional regulator with XRE-family HTH domain